MKMVLASNNAHKLDELQALFGDLGVSLVGRSKGKRIVIGDWDGRYMGLSVAA